MAAVLGGKSDSVRLLLASGADPELPNREGMTPLQAAAFQNQRDVIEALIEGGAVVEVRWDGPQGSTARYMDRSIMQKNKPRVGVGRNLGLMVTACCTAQRGGQERLQSMPWSICWISWM